LERKYREENLRRLGHETGLSFHNSSISISSNSSISSISSSSSSNSSSSSSRSSSKEIKHQNINKNAGS
jgi:hypothetical protein